MGGPFFPRRFETYSNASLTWPGRWWPSAGEGPASSGDEMRPLRQGEKDMVPVGGGKERQAR
jgi:hypothetical protein